jgi:DNA (cytosine-5)-methyltransferase 1
VTAYYNEIDTYKAEWLRNLISTGEIAPGYVDERDIREVRALDVRGYTQCHFFAGVGGWSVALGLAGWPDDRRVWTGSCPCQPFSEAGERRGAEDHRHLWPDWFRLIRECRPSIVFGEQVPEAIKLGWLDEVSSDFQSEDYAIGTAVLSACVVEARQERERLWFVARANGFAPQRASKPRTKRHPWPSDEGVARVAHGIPEQPFTRRSYGDAIIPKRAPSGSKMLVVDGELAKNGGLDA